MLVFPPHQPFQDQPQELPDPKARIHWGVLVGWFVFALVMGLVIAKELLDK